MMTSNIMFRGYDGHDNTSLVVISTGLVDMKGMIIPHWLSYQQGGWI